MTRMLLTIMRPDGSDAAEGEAEMLIVPIGTTLRFDNSITGDTYFVDIIGYDMHMRPIKGVSTAIHMHAFGEVTDRSSYKDIKGLSAAAFDDKSQANYSKQPKGSLVEKGS